MVAALIDTLYLAGKEEKRFLLPLRVCPVPKSLAWIQATVPQRSLLGQTSVLIQQWQLGSFEKQFQKLFCFSCP